MSAYTFENGNKASEELTNYIRSLSNLWLKPQPIEDEIFALTLSILLSMHGSIQLSAGDKIDDLSAKITSCFMNGVSRGIGHFLKHIKSDEYKNTLAEASAHIITERIKNGDLINDLR